MGGPQGGNGTMTSWSSSQHPLLFPPITTTKQITVRCGEQAEELHISMFAWAPRGQLDLVLLHEIYIKTRSKDQAKLGSGAQCKWEDKDSPSSTSPRAELFSRPYFSHLQSDFPSEYL